MLCSIGSMSFTVKSASCIKTLEIPSRSNFRLLNLSQFRLLPPTRRCPGTSQSNRSATSTAIVRPRFQAERNDTGKSDHPAQGGHWDDERAYVGKLLLRCVACAAAVKYGSLLVPQVTQQPHLEAALAIIAISVLIATGGLLWAARIPREG
eukprot:TRINITY_DN1670_c0_g4_i1.p1 TRINITY_DN1670_c0_g4~~TRINITY_DN1670_c0_g4_i1.p1  ORF type:complete len:151 (+),score=19.58 TRINITY_DN1670_c0_g4_i1:302-754(+)